MSGSSGRRYWLSMEFMMGSEMAKVRMRTESEEVGGKKRSFKCFSSSENL